MASEVYVPPFEVTDFEKKSFGLKIILPNPQKAWGSIYFNYFIKSDQSWDFFNCLGHVEHDFLNFVYFLDRLVLSTTRSYSINHKVYSTKAEGGCVL